MYKIVVTGGSGMVGKSLKKFLPNAIYLSSKDYDLREKESVCKMFNDHKPNCVIHLAAKVGGIIDNITKPAEYFTDNVLMNTLLLEYAHKFNVERFIGILSTCIYPDVVEEYPMKECQLHKGPPTLTNFSYGYAKRCLAVQIESYNKQYGTNYQYLIPCNLYGENDKFGENSHFIASLIKKIIEIKKNKSDVLELFGTGKPFRQFMYSDDLAWVIHQCLEQNIYESFNVATEDNLSIEEMAKIALNSCDLDDVKIFFDITKPDGQYRKDVSIDKLKSLLPNFKPLPLHKGIKKVYDKISK
jgi:GDP-L-fucose synthase